MRSGSAGAHSDDELAGEEEKEEEEQEEEEGEEEEEEPHLSQHLETLTWQLHAWRCERKRRLAKRAAWLTYLHLIYLFLAVVSKD